MDLNTQIVTLLVSFIYGIIFSFLVDIHYKYLYQKKIIFRVMFTFVFIITNVLVYFIVLKKINEAILHPYALGMIFVGFCLEHHFHRLVANHLKKCYTERRKGKR